MRGMSTLTTAMTTTTIRLTAIMWPASVQETQKNYRMIVQNNLIEINNIFTMDQLYTAYINCKKGKKSINTLKFEENLFKLLFELNNGTYTISRALCFVVIKPKIREIWAIDFRDRVIHHLIRRKIESFYETKTFPFSFLNSSYANRKEKGTLKAVKKLENLIKTNSYYLKLDI